MFDFSVAPSVRRTDFPTPQRVLCAVAALCLALTAGCGGGDNEASAAPNDADAPDVHRLAAADPAWTRIAGEGQAFTVSGTRSVRYGSGSAWITKSVTASGVCSNAFFGSDPLRGVVKQCEIAAGAAPPAVAQVCTPPVAAVDTSAVAPTVGSGTAASCTEAALRAAVNAHPVVTFNCGAAPATIAIASTIEVPANRNTVIDGGNKVTLDGRGSARLLNIGQPNYRTNSSGLTVQHITLKSGKAPAGGYVAPNPSNPACAYGFASGGGAAIQVRDARLHVIDVEFRDNAAATPGPDVGGGAIYAMGSLDVLVSGSRFIGNSGSNSGAIGMLQSNLRVFNSAFQNNSANGVGQNYRSAAVASCPGVGHAGQGGAGGNAGAIGIDGNSDTDVVVCGSTFTGNRANELAGALARSANGVARRITIDRSSFDANSAKQGGALYLLNQAPLEIFASTFSANRALGFGAAQLVASRFAIVNSTFSGNEATKGVGGVLGLNGNAATSVIQNATFADNKSSGGAGYFSAVLFGDANFSVSNSVFANNTTLDAWNPMQCGFNAVAGSSDLQWPPNRAVGGRPDTACVSGIAFADPLLGALAAGGGPTATRAPAATSPLRQAGRNCPATDQRGAARASASCTIGAVE